MWKSTHNIFNNLKKRVIEMKGIMSILDSLMNVMLQSQENKNSNKY